MHSQVPNAKAVMRVFRVRKRNTDEREIGGETSIVGNMRLSNQGELLEVHGSRIAEAWLGEF